MYNPVFLSKIVQCFMTGYEKDVDLKTIFYVLPIIMYKDSRDRLNQARSSSSLYSVFAKESEFVNYGVKLSTKYCLSQITNLFDDYTEVTKKTLIILSSQQKIIFKDKLSLIEKLDYKKTPSLIRDYFKAAYYLGMILSRIQLMEFEQFLEISSET